VHDVTRTTRDHDSRAALAEECLGSAGADTGELAGVQPPATP
jgi:hypothetical protein